MGVAKKGRGNNFQNCSTSSKVFYGCQLVISGEKSFLARSATIIPFGPLLYHQTHPLFLDELHFSRLILLTSLAFTCNLNGINPFTLSLEELIKIGNVVIPPPPVPPPCTLTPSLTIVSGHGDVMLWFTLLLAGAALCSV